MIYTFDRQGVERLVQWAEHHDNRTTLYDQPIAVGRHLLLVGDEGVYLSTHCEDNLLASPEDNLGDALLYVVYAKECDPRGPFEQWWETKRAGFGGDDGCEAIGLADIKDVLRLNGDGDLTLDITPSHIRLVILGTD